MRSWCLVLLVGCRPAVDERAELRDGARAILDRTCGACHESHLPTAMPAALAIYDLDEREWAARMSDLQLLDAFGRLDQPVPPDGHQSDVTAEERARFRRYVDAEAVARTRAPPCPPDDVLEAVHAAAYRLEHDTLAAGRDALARAASLTLGPLDEKTRHLLGRLAFAAAGGGDLRQITEQVRADLQDWTCLSKDQHRRFHERL